MKFSILEVESRKKRPHLETDQEEAKLPAPLMSWPSVHREPALEGWTASWAVKARLLLTQPATGKRSLSPRAEDDQGREQWTVA